MQSQRFNNKLGNPTGETMVIAHRGNWHHAPENTLQAIQNAMDSHVDIIEIDVQKTLDGRLILMHDDTVDRMTSGRGRLKDLSYDDIRSFQVKQSQGGEQAPYTSFHVPILEEVMRRVSGKIMVNLDKCWDIREEVYQVLLKTNTVQQALFKSEAPIEEVEEFLNSKALRPLYMHIANMKNDQGDFSLDVMDTIIDKLHPVAVEFTFKNNRLPDHIDKIIAYLSGKCRIWVNTLDGLGVDNSDGKALRDAEDGWEECLNRGVNMIQTDYPDQLLHYLQNRSF